jgi:hypothetical protein
MTLRAAIKKIEYGIKAKMDVLYFVNIYSEAFKLLFHTAFSTEQTLFYRARPADDSRLFKNISELKYPPSDKVIMRGRFNDVGESVAYMSANFLTPLAELGFDYYQMFCMAEVEYCVKDVLFFDIGVKATRSGWTEDAIEFIDYINKLITSPEQKNYPATIAFARMIFHSDAFTKTKNPCIGIAYNSAQEYKTNQTLHNIAVDAKTFDDCFKIKSAKYHLMSVDRSNGDIVIQDINESSILDNGDITWKDSFEDMRLACKSRFKSDCFLNVNELGEEFIIKFPEGSGKIVDRTETCFCVSFKNQKEISFVDKSIAISRATH